MSSFNTHRLSRSAFIACALVVAACGSDSKTDTGTPGTGGAAGGVSAAGGATTGTGGTVSGNGGATVGGGGTPSSGGTVSSGGTSGGSGGVATTGGAAGAAGASGGATATDGGAETDAGPTTPKGCRNNADCAGVKGKPLCDAKNDVCVACHTNAQCGATEECVQNACTPLTTCKSSLECASVAGGKTICDKTNSVCVQCAASADCGTGSVCTSRVCRKTCTSDNDCSADHMLCNKSLSFAGQCTECAANADCKAGTYCETGQCVPLTCTPAQQSCAQNNIVQCTDTGDTIIPLQQCALALLLPACVVDGDNAKCTTFCEDKKHDALETDVDCGGPNCSRCETGKGCVANTDCTSNKCTSSKCE
ncbi:MAG TPA: hypothetical protein VH062_22930 [Polyangiaceae bacterium]|jgi:Cys-rich repeat protein|nr:hypothetical protein [Polyangiaceae bacterium]